MTSTRGAIERAIDEGRMGDRLWLYATYHCNLACAYCLTESGPDVRDRRALSPDAMVRATSEAAELGLTCVGITGGEVFMVPWLPETLAEITSILPTVVLTNATLFTERLLDRLEPLASLDLAFQISLDSDQPARNDELRGPENFAKVLDAIPRLHRRGHRIRIATTVERQTDDELRRLCDLHRSLGISDDDHVVRSVVRRGRAEIRSMGVELGPDDVLPELTVTADGAFLHPFAPTVRHGLTDLDLLVTRQTSPLTYAADRFIRVVSGLPVGADVTRNIR